MNNITNTAFDLKIAYLKAQQQGFITYHAEVDIMQINEDSFKSLFKDKQYVVQEVENVYQYIGRAEHMNFMCTTESLFNEKDKELIIKKNYKGSEVS